MRLVKDLSRFGGAALCNAAFGYGTYALLVAVGLHPFAAQALAFVAGTLFNMRTYGIAFGRRAARGRFVLAYAINYLVSLALLAAFTRVADPYAAGLLTLFGAAAINFAVLRGFVFARSALPA